MTSQLSTVGDALFQDDFAGTGRLSDAKWHINKWQQNNNPAWLGQTNIRQELPFAENGVARIRLDTYFTDQYTDPGKSFLGSEAITNQAVHHCQWRNSFRSKIEIRVDAGRYDCGIFSY